jgi:hypothetical protein
MAMTTSNSTSVKPAGTRRDRQTFNDMAGSSHY